MLSGWVPDVSIHHEPELNGGFAQLAKKGRSMSYGSDMIISNSSKYKDVCDIRISLIIKIHQK
jgi:hypothetical protein